MKSIVNNLLVICAAGLMFGACKKDQNQQVLNTTNAKTSLTASSSTIVLDSAAASANNTAVTLKWDSVNYGTRLAITYSLQFDSVSDNFAHPISKSIGVNILTQSYSVSDLNTMAKSLGLVGFTAGNIQVRVAAKVSDSVALVYSNTVTLNITPYTKAEPIVLSYLWVPGAYQNWAPATAPQLAASDGTKYEGFVMITAANAPSLAFKITSEADWSGTNYGTGGTTTTVGNVTTDVLSSTGDNEFAPAASYYFIQVNYNSLAYTATAISAWTASGTAATTPVNLTYDSTSMVWSATNVTLAAGNLKYTGVGSPTSLTYGKGTDNFHLIKDGGDITVETAGTYDIKLNMSSPLNYKDTLIKH